MRSGLSRPTLMPAGYVGHQKLDHAYWPIARAASDGYLSANVTTTLALTWTSVGEATATLFATSG